jgi:hypothetical protein
VTRVDREPYVFEHPGLEFFFTRGGRLGVRIGVRRPERGAALYVENWAGVGFPQGWEVVARAWLAKNDAGVKR